MHRTCLLTAVLLCLCSTSACPAPPVLHPQALSVAGKAWPMAVPTGMQLELLTDALEQPRLMEFLPNGVLLIGSGSGKVFRLEPPYTQVSTLVELEDYPHSLAYREGELLIAQTDGLYRAAFTPEQTRLEWDDVELLAALPGGGGHSSRTVAIGPDGRIYVSLGISGNCSNEYLDASYPFNDRRGGVLVLDEDGDLPRWQTHAAGLRNPVGFDWHPQTGILYASNNGPDHLGYDQPPEYFSRLTPGSFHGMPWYQFNGERIERDNCIRKPPPRPPSEVAPPVATFPARNAPMGVAFITGQVMDKAFQNNAIVALKGSWGTRPSGGMFGMKSTRRPPALVMVEFSEGKAGKVYDFVTGFQQADGERLARPTGVSMGPDGYLYFSSDSHTEGLFRLRPVQE